ncbi:ATP-binding protein [Ramlibacter sp.]|uniref:hybrid sensor histidine kinase/response regulator n=1 Tax=Ramlibacter sp. TaxID=1917967 RepID=UPI0035B0CF4A
MSETGAPARAVFEDSIRAMRRPLMDSGWSVLAVAALLCLALLPYHPGRLLAAWFAGVVLVQYGPGRAMVRLWPDRAVAHSPAFIARVYTVGSLLSGGYWGLSVLAFLDPAHPEQQFFVALSLGGMAASNVAVQAFHPPMMRSYVISLVLPFATWALLQGDMLHTYLGAGMLLLLSYLLYFGHFHARTLRRFIELRHENAALVERLREQTEALARASQAKSQFFAAASHDLRQPLHALGYYTSLLRPDEHDAPHVARIAQCIGSLDDLLEGVLDISRLDAGRMRPTLAPVALHELVRRLAALYEGSAAARGLSLRVHARPAWAISDAAMLERVVSNLLSNAVRYTRRGGVLLAVRSVGGSVRLQVIDTGIGIEPAEQDRIFDEFVQLNNPERDPSQGVGLGLATVRRMCNLLDHPLQLRSVPGRGTRFTLVLPACPPPAPQETPAGAADTPAAAGALTGHVLVVDDHALVRDSLVHTLSSWGLQCDGAGDAAQARALAQGRPYDAVLCDWRLPDDEDGLRLLAQLRASQPALRLAALVTAEDEASLGQVPAEVPVLRKPIRPIRLRALLSAHLAAPPDGAP